MELIDAVDRQFGTRPLAILVDEIPSIEEAVFQQTSDGMRWVAEANGHFRCFKRSSLSDTDRIAHVREFQGEEIELTRSRAKYIAPYFDSEMVEVVIASKNEEANHDEPFPEGPPLYKAAVSREVAEDAASKAGIILPDPTANTISGDNRSSTITA